MSRRVNGQQVVYPSSHDKPISDLLILLRESTALSGPHWNRSLLTYLLPSSVARLLFLNEIYDLIVDVPGVILEFGVHRGATMSTLTSLRMIKEPFNHTRRIVGFDTFTGLAGIDEVDLAELPWEAGDYGTEEGWPAHLAEVLKINESLAPLAHIDKFDLREGDVFTTLPLWLELNPGALIAGAFLDLDLFEPTKFVLDLIKPRLTKGSVVVLDELTDPAWPGEALALMDIWGLDNLSLRRSPLQNNCGYFVK